MSRLIDKIKEYQEAFKQKVPQELQDTMLGATAKLQEAGISKNALQAGDEAKNFTLPNFDGQNVELDEVLKEKDFVVISFYRGMWCPYCNLELKSLQEIKPELDALNAELIAISPQTPDNSLETKEKNELTFKVVSDTNNLVAKDYGLIFSLAQELRPIYESFGINIPVSNDDDSYEIPMPATYVINKNKEIVYSFIDEDYTKRLEPEVILEQLRK